MSNLAITSLTLVFTSNKLLNMIIEAQTKKQLSGQVFLVIKQLVEKHKLIGAIALVGERIVLSKIKMSAKEDPEELLRRIKVAEIGYNTKSKRIKGRQL